VNFVFDRWLQDRGGKKNVEGEKILQCVYDRLIQHDSRFKKVNLVADKSCLEVNQDEKIRSIQNQMGYVHEHKEGKTYYIINELFKKEICEDFSIKTVTRVLKKVGRLIVEGDGNPKKSIDGNSKRQRFVTIFVKRHEDGQDKQSDKKERRFEEYHFCTGHTGHLGTCLCITVFSAFTCPEAILCARKLPGAPGRAGHTNSYVFRSVEPIARMSGTPGEKTAYSEIHVF
jgi:hypothetical protein